MNKLPPPNSDLNSFTSASNIPVRSFKDIAAEKRRLDSKKSRNKNPLKTFLNARGSEKLSAPKEASSVRSTKVLKPDEVLSSESPELSSRPAATPSAPKSLKEYLKDVGEFVKYVTPTREKLFHAIDAADVGVETIMRKKNPGYMRLKQITTIAQLDRYVKLLQAEATKKGETLLSGAEEVPVSGEVNSSLEKAFMENIGTVNTKNNKEGLCVAFSLFWSLKKLQGEPDKQLLAHLETIGKWDGNLGSLSPDDKKSFNAILSSCSLMQNPRDNYGFIREGMGNIEATQVGSDDYLAKRAGLAFLEEPNRIQNVKHIPFVLETSKGSKKRERLEAILEKFFDATEKDFELNHPGAKPIILLSSEGHTTAVRISHNSQKDKREYEFYDPNFYKGTLFKPEKQIDRKFDSIEELRKALYKSLHFSHAIPFVNKLFKRQVELRTLALYDKGNVPRSAPSADELINDIRDPNALEIRELRVFLEDSRKIPDFLNNKELSGKMAQYQEAFSKKLLEGSLFSPKGLEDSSKDPLEFKEVIKDLDEAQSCIRAVLGKPEPHPRSVELKSIKDNLSKIRREAPPLPSDPYLALTELTNKEKRLTPVSS